MLWSRMLAYITGTVDQELLPRNFSVSQFVMQRPVDLWKLRAKHLVENIPHSRRYRLLPHTYQICLVFLKLYEKIYAPLTASILQPIAADESIPKKKITALDRRYTAVIQALDDLVEAVDLKAGMVKNSNELK